MFNIKCPVILAGMNQVSDAKLVAAVSNAGGLGVLAVSAFTPEDARRHVREIRDLTDKPFGINQALTRPLAKEKMDVAVEEKVPVVCYSLGKPTFIDQVHEYGGKVVGSIALSKHAVKAAQLGVDSIVVVGHEAAAHGGLVTSLVLLPIVSSLVNIPLIAAGGFSSGKSLTAAFILGAEAVWMGSRFVASQECQVAEPLKQLILNASEEDTVYSDIFDGMPSRMLKSPASEAYMNRGRVHITSWLSSALAIKRMLGLSWVEFLKSSWKMRNGEERLGLFEQALMADHVTRMQKAIEGDREDGIMPIGQSIGDIKDIPTCQEIVDRIVEEAEAELERIQKVKA